MMLKLLINYKMGACNCNCLHKEQEGKLEMVNGKVPGVGENNNKIPETEIINIHTENDYEEDKIITQRNVEQIREENNGEEKSEEEIKLNNNGNVSQSQNNEKGDAQEDSSILSKLQELPETIFDYFNEIRTSPDEFKQVADEHGVMDIIQKAINAPNQSNSLIINSFFNLLLSSYINDNTDDGDNNDNIIESMEKEEKMKQYNKKLFEVEADIKYPNEAVWNLFSNNKDIAYETFFANSIEYLVISCQKKVNDNQKFKCYFLLLTKRI